MAGHQQHTLWGGTVWHPSGASTPLRFPGQYDDAETGLHYNNQRYYDPVTGSYLSPDPLGLGPAPNPHVYVPNPHVETDPLGLVGCGLSGEDVGSGNEGTNPGSIERVGDFANKRLAFQHYAKHAKGVDLRILGRLRYVGPDVPEFDNFKDYSYSARKFMGGGKPPDVLEGVRPGSGDLIRLDPKSGYFGVRSPTGVIRTFFRPRGGPSDWVQYFHDQFQP